MKTFKKLYNDISSFENLWLAAKKARKGKKYTSSSAFFHFHLERELLQIQKQLVQKTYRPGTYRTFYIHDPKTRMISAAPFRDRVVHHALCNIIEPLFDKTFIFDSYANRVGKGTHKAIERYQQYARKYPYVLKCDIRKFFPSLDLDILREKLHRKIACQATRWIIDQIIDHSNEQEAFFHYFPGDELFTPYERRKGLPIGNLTSQFWANVYMNGFDHFVKEELGVPGYIRYVDDFVLFSHDKKQLAAWKLEVESYLLSIRLLLHPHKTHIHQTDTGVPFLGFRVFPYHRYVKRAKIWRYKRHLRKTLPGRDSIDSLNLECGLNSWRGHILFGSSKRLENQIFLYLQEQGLSLYQRPSGSWGLVDQQQ